jgi:LmbE family N-acetylglucosaminyl deacetylase
MFSGGSIYKHTQRGDEVVVVYLTDGSGGAMDQDPKELSRIRYEEARNACKILGVQHVEFLGFKDGFLFFNEETLKAVGRIIRKYKPHRVYTHHPDELMGIDNLDHAMVGKLVLEAAFKTAYFNYPELGPDVWRVEEIYAYESISPLASPTTYVDITDVIDVKVKSYLQHKSEVEAQPYWFDMMKDKMRMHGTISRVGEYVEVFQAFRTKLF